MEPLQKLGAVLQLGTTTDGLQGVANQAGVAAVSKNGPTVHLDDEPIEPQSCRRYSGLEQRLPAVGLKPRTNSEREAGGSRVKRRLVLGGSPSV